MSGAERIWAILSGIPTSRRRERLFMVFQAFFDGSADKQRLVLAGYIGSSENWAKFSDEWQRLLDEEPKMTSFKMSQLAMTPNWEARAEKFYRVIEGCVVGAVSCSVDINDLAKVVDSTVWPISIKIGDYLNNPYFIAFNEIIGSIWDYQLEYFKIDQPIDLIFDDQSEKLRALEGWDFVRATCPPERRKYLSAMPHFERDDDFLPLQSADFLAWWVRKWEHQTDSSGSREIGFPWKAKKLDIPLIRKSYTEQGIRELFEESLAPERILLVTSSPGYLSEIADEKERIDYGIILPEDKPPSFLTFIKRFFGG